MFLLEFHFLCLTPALFVLYYIPVISFLRLYSLYRQNRPQSSAPASRFRRPRHRVGGTYERGGCTQFGAPGRAVA